MDFFPKFFQVGKNIFSVFTGNSETENRVICTKIYELAITKGLPVEFLTFFPKFFQWGKNLDTLIFVNCSVHNGYKFFKKSRFASFS